MWRVMRGVGRISIESRNIEIPPIMRLVVCFLKYGVRNLKIGLGCIKFIE